MKYIRRILFSLFFIIIGWILANWYNTFREERVIPTVVTIGVDKGRIEEKVSLSAKVSEKEVVNITSGVPSGIVESVYVKPGDYVKRGQMLVSLREEGFIHSLKKEEFNLTSELKKLNMLKDISSHPEVIEKNTEINKIEWKLKDKEEELKDEIELHARGAISYREIEKKEMEKKKLEMDLKSLKDKRERLIEKLKDQRRELEINIPAIKHRIAELKEQIKACKVTSPINGIVKRVEVEKNKKVEYGTLLVSIATIAELVAKGPLKESNFFLVKEGQRVELFSEGLSKGFTGRVIKVLLYPGVEKKESPSSKEEGSFQVITSIDNPSGLVAGMVLSCDIIVRESPKETITIPPEALYEEDAVLVVENGRIKKREIVVGETSSDKIEVIDGLKVGERVIVQYPEEIREGMRVKEERRL